MAELHLIKPETPSAIMEMINDLQELVSTGVVAGFAYALAMNDGTGRAEWSESGTALIANVSRLAYKIQVSWDGAA